VFTLIILSGGGLYGDESDNSAFAYNDPRITHYIVDRPAENIVLVKNKEFVQPQWVFDSVNAKTLLPISDYSPGKKLPPHLSPFFEYDGEEYKAKNQGNYIEDIVKINANIKNEIAKQDNEEQTHLNEMLMTKNKKKLLDKIREEKNKKKKQPKVDKTK